ncbi:MAG: patatin-like phospholipase family protein [Sphingomonadaceae bacterium]
MADQPERQGCSGPADRSGHLQVLVLQGGGALGAYHLGVFEELVAYGIAPDWVAGISIGAINAAIIAGNRPKDRLPALERFWERVSSGLAPLVPLPDGFARDLWSEGAAFWVAAAGVPGFFRPRFPPPKLAPRGSEGAVSYYDMAPLAETLDELVDWDWLNDGPVRLSVGAVQVESGRIHFFDSRGGRDQCRIGPAHVLASAALPPAFAPVLVDDAWYWDGGIASNAPIQHVLDNLAEANKNIFQVDLFPAEGPLPETLLDVETRAQDIRFSTRTRLNTAREVELSRARALVRRLLEDCNPALDRLAEEEVATLRAFASERRVEIAQIIYRDKAAGGRGRGHEFSRPTMEAHRAAGRRDAARALASRDWRQPPTPGDVRCPGL